MFAQLVARELRTTPLIFANFHWTFMRMVMASQHMQHTRKLMRMLSFWDGFLGCKRSTCGASIHVCCSCKGIQHHSFCCRNMFDLYVNDKCGKKFFFCTFSPGKFGKTSSRAELWWDEEPLVGVPWWIVVPLEQNSCFPLEVLEGLGNLGAHGHAQT